MKFVDAILEVAESLMSDKVRTILSILGVIISVSSITSIQIIGNGAARAVTNIMNDSNNDNKIYINIKPSENNLDIEYDVLGKNIIPESAYFTDELLLKFEEIICCDIQRICSYDYKEIELKCKNQIDSPINVIVVGCTRSYLDNNIIEVEKGHIFDEKAEEGKCVVIISDRFSNLYFGDENPIGKQIMLLDNNEYLSLYVIGVYCEEIQDDIKKELVTEIYVPINYLRNQNQLIGYLADEAVYKVKGVSDLEALRKKIYAFFKENYCSDDWEIAVAFDVDKNIQTNRIVQYIVKIVTIIGFLAFVIGGLCIVNMMLIIVDEKTLEIGIKKAVGARNKDIYKELLVESYVLVFLGVCSGVLVGCFLGYIMTVVMSNVYADLFEIEYFSIPWRILGIAVILAIVIGMFSTIGAVNKAKKMTVSSILGTD